MNLISRARVPMRRILLRLLERGRGHHGREILDDVIELYEERRARLGRPRAMARAAWDIVSLYMRPAPPPRVADAHPRRLRMLRAVDDVSFALRSIARRPLVGATVVVTLTVGLGLAILTFALVDRILLRPLLFPRGEELLSIYGEFRPESGYVVDRSSLSPPEIADYQGQSRAVDAAAWQFAGVVLAVGDGFPERVPGVNAMAGVFRILETPAAVGRTLTPADNVPGAPCVVVLSHGLWQERFGGARDAVGRRVSASGRACEVVGVMPAHFAFPGQGTRLWMPLVLDPDPNTRGNHGLMAVGRLRRGMSLADARSELSVMMAAWAGEHPHHRGHGVVIAPLREDLVSGVSEQLIVLAWAVGLVLAVTAANVSSLMVAHGEARRKELAVRAALGAGRASLVRQLIAEGVLLACAGGAGGALAARMSLDAVVAAYPQTLPRSGEIALDFRVYAAAAAASIVLGVVIGLLPSLRLSRLDLTDALRSDRQSGLALGLRAQRWLVIAELALAVAVTTSALLLAQSFSRLQHVPLGFDPSNVTAAIVALPAGDAGRERTIGFYGALAERVRSLPGVAAAGAIFTAPFRGSPPPDDFTIDGRPVAPPTTAGFNAHYVMVTPGAFEALGIPIVSGRAIDATDVDGGHAVAIVNRTAARTFWPGESPIGRRVRYPTGVRNGEWAGWGPWLTIVGVAEDVRFFAPPVEIRPAIFVAHAQLPRPSYDGRTMTLVVRTTSEWSDSAAALRNVVKGLDARASVSVVQTMETAVSAGLARPRFLGWIMIVFAVVSLSVAALGVYGVIAYAVERRTRDIGVRMALGATRGAIVRWIGGQTIAMMGAGLLAGLAGAAALAQAMRNLLYGVDPIDVPTYALVCVILSAAVVTAVLVPARRAVSVDPLIALRAD